MSIFGRMTRELLNDVGKSALEGAIVGGVVGGYRAKKQGEEHPWVPALKTAGAWAAADAITEGLVGILAPNLRGGSTARSALVSGALGGATGFIEGYSEAKIRHDDDPWKAAIISSGEWAAIDAGVDFMTRSGLPAIKKAFE